MKHEQAVGIATDALIWLADRPDDLSIFLAAAGAAPSDLRDRAGDPEFLGFLLDFVLQEDARVLAFATDARLPPETLARARSALPGGYAPDWT